ncbi:MAG TPA: hypothetical protein VIF12_02375, partial [Micavibrio sp.]
MDAARLRAADTVAKFLSVVEQAGAQDEFKSALENTPDDITGNRTYKQIALDDAMNVYETLVADIVRKAPELNNASLPIDLYKQMLETRLDHSVTEEEALATRSEAIQNRLNAPVPLTPESPTFLNILFGRVGLSEIMRLKTTWTSLVARVENLLKDETGIQPATQFNAQAAPASAPAKSGLRRIGGNEQPQAGLRPISGGGSNDNSKLPVPVLFSKPLEALFKKYGNGNFTDKARQAPPPIFGRAEDVQSLIKVLLQQDSPHAVMHGEEGVGQTSVVQGLANRIASGKVPAGINDTHIIGISLATILHDIMPNIRKTGVEPQTVLKSILEET